MKPAPWYYSITPDHRSLSWQMQSVARTRSAGAEMSSGMRQPGASNSLREYYCKFFPVEVLCELLGREWRGRNQLHKRELCIENVDACYIRWLSVSAPAELRSLFREKRVEKFHTGAIFSGEPRMKKNGVAIEPVEREFVVDIDVNDYDVWGIDANDKESCDYAWPIVAFGMKMVKHVLRKHFGFENMLLVYSGRRGAHMSVYDARACALTDEARTAIVSYLQPGDKPGKSGRLCYSYILESEGFTELFESHVLPFWSNCCLKPREEGGMGVLDGQLEKEAFMDLFGDQYASDALTLTNDTGAQMWSKLTKYANESWEQCRTWSAIHETVMCYLWPRLDGAVSKHRNHLSKSVFSIHPKTGCICVPIKGDSFLFKPTSCPKYDDLVRGDEAATVSFKTAVSILQRFVKTMKSADSESWSPPRIEVGPCSVYSMVSRKRGRGEGGGESDCLNNKYCFTDRERFYADTTRVFCALASDADPNVVSVYFYTTLPDPCVGEVLRGYAPPSRKAGAFPVKWFVNRIREASNHPGVEVLLDRAYTCVLFHPRQASKQLCEQRMGRLVDRLLDPNMITTVSAKWYNVALAAWMNDQVKETWETKHIYLN